MVVAVVGEVDFCAPNYRNSLYFRQNRPFITKGDDDHKQYVMKVRLMMAITPMVLRHLCNGTG